MEPREFGRLEGKVDALEKRLNSVEGEIRDRLEKLEKELEDGNAKQHDQLENLNRLMLQHMTEESATQKANARALKLAVSVAGALGGFLVYLAQTLGPLLIK